MTGAVRRLARLRDLGSIQNPDDGCYFAVVAIDLSCTNDHDNTVDLAVLGDLLVDMMVAVVVAAIEDGAERRGESRTQARARKSATLAAPFVCPFLNALDCTHHAHKP